MGVPTIDCFKDSPMSRIVLGTTFVCLFATSSLATGFEVPPLPDFDLQRLAAQNWGVHPDITTGGVHGTEALRSKTHAATTRTQDNQKPITAQ
jgi:hypothetical protein